MYHRPPHSHHSVAYFVDAVPMVAICWCGDHVPEYVSGVVTMYHRPPHSHHSVAYFVDAVPMMAICWCGDWTMLYIQELRACPPFITSKGTDHHCHAIALHTYVLLSAQPYAPSSQVCLRHGTSLWCRAEGGCSGRTFRSGFSLWW